jgi:hypothetical protein
VAHIRNISGADRIVPALGRTVEADTVAEVPDDQLASYVCQPGIWADETAPASSPDPAPAPEPDHASPPADEPTSNTPSEG